MGQVGDERSAPSPLTPILHSVDDSLFSEGSLGSALETRAQQMGEAVEFEPEESPKQADASEWAVALTHHLGVSLGLIPPPESV